DVQLWLGGLLVAVMLFLFFLKGLFKRRRLSTDAWVRVSESDQPVLFDFLRRLCDEGQSPFPRAVYVSHEVNAAVFYPSSIVSLVWPIRKNLVIGTGLLNVLDVSELKAVLAHEFGHFSQSSMKLGQYVYVANQVIGNMVFARDFWDSSLQQWCRLDVRLSFPAWTLRGIVWILRQFLAFVFRAINLANLSLMRQMEFNADLHAVRLTGSDALIAGLWKAERAHIASQIAFAELASIAAHGKYSDDLCFHQSAALDRLDDVLSQSKDDSAHVRDLQDPYVWGPKIHFQSERIAQVEMWQTHPSTREREINAKQTYVPCPPSRESAWSLFRSAPELRTEISKKAYLHVLHVAVTPQTKFLPAAEVQQMISVEHEEMKQADHYHGFYDNRFVEPGHLESMAGGIDGATDDGTLDVASLRNSAAEFAGENLGVRMARLPELEAQWAKRTDRVGVGKEREDLYQSLRVGDSALFRYFYFKSGDASVGSPEKRAELLERYRFLLAIQDEIRGLVPFEPQFAAVVGALQARKKFSNDDVKHVLALFEAAWNHLYRSLKHCDSLRIPRLSHLEQGQSVRSFVFPGELVSAPAGDGLEGAWIGRFLGEFGQVMSRLRKLHFKNLGLLLKLQESLDPELHGMRAEA
ncbi:MAG: M48 family metalloprotease, partial [Planctomycetes bacterium]|nr:M48 family metalloprotease [Planctomycetota bacterium]